MINYTLLGESIKYYEKEGFERLEVPWMVPDFIDRITRPEHSKGILTSLDLNLVASGEQSFLYLYYKNQLPKGKFQTITPCHRIENESFIHFPQFMKNELIITDRVDANELEWVVEKAKSFFSGWCNPEALTIVDTSDGYDIMLNGIEIGSYGIRKTGFLRWIYATGLAEPRFSMTSTRTFKIS